MPELIQLKLLLLLKLRSLAQSKAKPKQNLIPQSLLSLKKIYLMLTNAKHVRTHYQGNKLFINTGNFNQH